MRRSLAPWIVLTWSNLALADGPKVRLMDRLHGGCMAAMPGSEHPHHSGCAETAASEFEIERTERGVRFVSANGELALSVVQPGPGVAPFLGLATPGDDSAQTFRITEIPGGSVRIDHEVSGHSLSVNRLYDGVVRLGRTPTSAKTTDAMSWEIRPADLQPKTRLRPGEFISSIGGYLTSPHKTYFALPEAGELVVRRGSGPRERGPVVYASCAADALSCKGRSKDARRATYLAISPTGALVIAGGAAPGLVATELGSPEISWMSVSAPYAGEFEVILDDEGRLVVRDTSDQNPVMRTPPGGARAATLRLTNRVSCRIPKDWNPTTKLQCLVSSMRTQGETSGWLALDESSPSVMSVAREPKPFWATSDAAGMRFYTGDGRGLAVLPSGSVAATMNDTLSTVFNFGSQERPEMTLTAGQEKMPCAALSLSFEDPAYSLPKPLPDTSGLSSLLVRQILDGRRDTTLVCDPSLDFAAGISQLADVTVAGNRCSDPTRCFAVNTARNTR